MRQVSARKDAPRHRRWRAHLYGLAMSLTRLLPIHTPLFRLLRRNLHQARHDPRRALDWKHSDDGGPWAVVLAPTRRYQVEIAVLTLFLPGIVVAWFLLNCGLDALPGTVAALLAAAVAPWLGWVAAVRMFHRTEVLGPIWDAIPVRSRDWVRTLVRLPERRLPYLWSRGTAEELLLRYAMKTYFQRDAASRVAEGESLYVMRLALWFLAPVYLSLTALLLQAATLGWEGAIHHHRPRADALFALILTMWFLQGYLYYRLQSTRIESQLRVDPGFGGEYVPGAFQGTLHDDPKWLKQPEVRLGVPAALSLIAAIAFPLIQSLLASDL